MTFRVLNRPPTLFWRHADLNAPVKTKFTAAGLRPITFFYGPQSCYIKMPAIHQRSRILGRLDVG
jgi:hypothetical protein